MEKRINHTQSITHALAQKVFSNTEITAQFMSDILELPVHEVKLLKPYEALDDSRTGITTLAQLASGSEMIIEIQIAEEVDINESYYLYLSNYFTKNKELFEAKNFIQYTFPMKYYHFTPFILHKNDVSMMKEYSIHSVY